MTDAKQPSPDVPPTPEGLGEGPNATDRIAELMPASSKGEVVTPELVAKLMVAPAASTASTTDASTSSPEDAPGKDTASTTTAQSEDISASASTSESEKPLESAKPVESATTAAIASEAKSAQPVASAVNAVDAVSVLKAEGTQDATNASRAEGETTSESASSASGEIDLRAERASFTEAEAPASTAAATADAVAGEAPAEITAIDAAFTPSSGASGASGANAGSDVHGSHSAAGRPSGAHSIYPEAGHGPGAKAVSGALVLGALGVVFGDIGTSPLYTIQECVGGAHGVQATPENVLGVLSMILWSLTLVVTVKYLAFLMEADNQGEGGIMALLALVPEKMRAPALGKVGWVATLVIVGAALLFGDGIITPAISVLSAMEGLGVATDKLKDAVVPSTVVILIGLFAIQSRGTGSIGRLFGPVMIVWFLVIGALGGYHTLQHPEVLHAVWPGYGVAFFQEHGWHGIRILGSVVLAVTGGEALYADMGHFGRKPIRIAWLAMVFPCLLLCYMGQCALLLGNPKAAAQPFYAMLPEGMWIYPMVGLAAMATVIASQALISGVFSLTHQAISLGFFPRITVRHTSGESEGQIYVPLLNWGLAVACIALVLVFKESSKLAAAFGLAVSGTMLITSVIFYVVTRYTWSWPLWKAGGLLALFLSFDIAFVVANGLKFFDGGYLPFTVGVFFVIIMITWRIGRGLLTKHYLAQSHPIEGYLATLDEKIVARIPGTALMMASQANGVPPVLYRTVKRFKVAHETVILLTIITDHIPNVPLSKRVHLDELSRGFFRVTVHFGFVDQPDVPMAIEPILAQLPGHPALADLVYMIGRETVVAQSGGEMSMFTETIFAILMRNARAATDYFRLPPDQVVELAKHIDL